MGAVVDTDLTAMVDAMRARGAVEVTYGGLSVRFAAPVAAPVAASVVRAQTREEAAAEYERVLLGSASE